MRYFKKKNVKEIKIKFSWGAKIIKPRFFRKKRRVGFKSYRYLIRYYFKTVRNLEWLDCVGYTMDYNILIAQRIYRYIRFIRKYTSLCERTVLASSKLLLIRQANKRFGLYKKGRGICLPGYIYRKRLPGRLCVDNKFKDIVNSNMRRKHEAALDFLHFKNNFWIRDIEQRKLLNLIWKKYRYFRSWRPYSYINKKYKMYFNWGDYHVFHRYPIYRRKCQVLYNYPLFANYLYLHKNQIKEQHLFRWLFRLKYKQLVRKFKKSVSGTKRAFEFMFLNFFEMRIDTLIYRLNFAFSIKQAKQWVNRSFFKVNSKTIGWYSYHVSYGDVIIPITYMRTHTLKKKQWHYCLSYDYINLRLFYRPLQADQYPSHVIFNERVPAALIINLPDPYKIRHNKSYSIQFLTLSLNKYS